MGMYIFGSFVAIDHPFAGKFGKTRFLGKSFEGNLQNDFFAKGGGGEKSGKMAHSKKS